MGSRKFVGTQGSILRLPARAESRSKIISANKELTELRRRKSPRITHAIARNCSRRMKCCSGTAN